jgi:O-antigen/teichoic acid export membrane protein
MQFVQSVGFTVIGIGWLTIYGTIEGLVYSFVAATLLAILPGAFTLASGWKGLPKSQEPFEPSSMWRRVLPFAIALWVMNLLTNVFALSDRYMILHLMPGSSIDGQAAIGQYHSGRIIPVLLMSLASPPAYCCRIFQQIGKPVAKRPLVNDYVRSCLELQYSLQPARQSA